MKKVLFIVVILGVLAVVGGMAAFSSLSLPANPADTQGVSFVIPKGRGLSWVATNLESQGIIKSALVFRALAWKEGLATKLQAGTYTLSKSQSITEILAVLQKGTDDTWVTLLEGWRAEEITEELGKELGESFDTAEFLALAKSKEGYLYPDTYLFPKDVDPTTVLSFLQNTFNRRITDQMRTEITRQGRTLEEVVTLASIIEREGNTKESKEMISGILHNRLDIGMALQVDATLQYIKGYNAVQKSWWAPPLAADKALSSPYNTYIHAGLPPGPIANPGIDSIMAAIYPKDNSYFYYITGNDGEMYYAEDLAGHNANVDRYLR